MKRRECYWMDRMKERSEEKKKEQKIRSRNKVIPKCW
jgi:hypothetical protein